MTTEIREIVIDLKTREITCFDEQGNKMLFPLTSDGGTVMKYTKVSSGGHIIAALARMLEGYTRAFHD